jgi:hypothetical protein
MLQHVHIVQRLLAVCIYDIQNRAYSHDRSKIFSKEELEGFRRLNRRSDDIEFGTPPYIEQLAMLEETLDHHYKANRHHPEHFKDGINDMSLIDLIEMVMDWMASTIRSKNGNIEKSLPYLQDRFKISDQLLKIIKNTIDYIEEKDCLPR